MRDILRPLLFFKDIRGAATYPDGETDCRRSQDREDSQTLSLYAQLRDVRELVARENLDVIDTITESQSAYKTGRKHFDFMLERIEMGQADAIITWQANRLARNSLDGGRLIYMMDQKKLKEIRTMTKTFSNSGNDKFFLQIEFGMAKKSSDDTSDYMKRDARSKLLKGEWVGMAPVGYLNIDAQGKIAGKYFDLEKQKMLGEIGRPLRRVEKDPIISPFMRQFFDYFLSDYRTLKEMAEFINKLGVRSPRYRGKFTISMVDKILKNPFYAGQLRYENELFPAVHEPIISLREFEEIQNQIADTPTLKSSSMSSYIVDWCAVPSAVVQSLVCAKQNRPARNTNTTHAVSGEGIARKGH